MASLLVHKTLDTADGGQLSYYTVGSGPSLLVIHGNVCFALTHRELAQSLSPYFTVHTASRRGRGLSTSYPSTITEANPFCDPSSKSVIQVGSKAYQRTYNESFTSAVLATEIDDLNALIAATKAETIISVSSGSVIVLHALLNQLPGSPISQVRKVILFEPPVFFSDLDTPIDLSGISRFEKETADGDTLGAMVTAMQTVQLGPGWIPRWLMKGVSALMMRYQENEVTKKRAAGEEDQGVSTMKGLGGMLRYDFAVVEGTIGESRRFQTLENGAAEILLLHGSNSPDYLKQGIEALAGVIPRAKKVMLNGVGHEVLCNADMRGQPAKAVPDIREFLA